jgi:DNA invertase Pin-like site-specific DNA recombinase
MGIPGVCRPRDLRREKESAGFGLAAPGARRRRIDVVVVWLLDRSGRSLKHLITLLDEFQALQVPLISLREGSDLTTPAGRLQ